MGWYKIIYVNYYVEFYVNTITSSTLLFINKKYGISPYLVLVPQRSDEFCVSAVKAGFNAVRNALLLFGNGVLTLFLG